MTTSLVFNSGCQLLEGPIFDKENKHLYFVSILNYLVYFYNPGTNEILSVKLDSPVGCVFLSSFKKVIAATKNGLFEVDFKNLQTKFIYKIDIPSNVRFNDGIKDEKGRFILGTMGYPKAVENIGQVFSYQKKNHTTLIHNTTISNGLAFSLDNKFLYFIDTPTKKVAKYRYQMQTGKIFFESYVIEFVQQGSPD